MRDLALVDRLFGSALARFYAIPTRQRASGSVTFAQMKVLFVLNRRRTATLGDIARRLNVGAPTATGLVSRLVDGGFVRRDRAASDGRRAALTLRPGGRRLLDGFVRRRRQRVARLLAVLGAADRRRLVAALRSLDGILSRCEAD